MDLSVNSACLASTMAKIESSTLHDSNREDADDNNSIKTLRFCG